MKNHLLLVGLGATLFGCAENVDSNVDLVSTPQFETATEIETSRSLMVTEHEILNMFSLHETLSQLISDAGSSQSPADVLTSWAAARQPCGPFNDYPVSCRDAGAEFDLLETEGNPSLDRYKAIALLNRFDNADPEGADCGEYRIAFNDLRDIVPRFSQENFFIFEARMPNPSPELGLQGCRPIVDFWAGLSSIEDTQARGQALHDFFFDGLDGVPPAISLAHFAGGETGSGQIRLNAQIDRSSWAFMEFRAEANCSGECSLEMVQSTTKEVPFEELSGDDHERSALFQDAVLDSMNTPGKALLATTMTDLSVDLPDAVNVGKVVRVINQPVPFLDGASNSFQSKLQERLDEVGSPLTPTQILNRVDTLTCGGCHQATTDLGQGLDLPAMTFEFLGGSGTEEGPNGARIPIGAALRDVFLPERKVHLENYLQGNHEPCSEGPLSLQSAIASSAESGAHAATFAIDKDWTTRWSSEFSDPQSLTLDLGAQRHLSRVVLHWEAAASSHYLLAVSATGEPGSWVDVHEQTAGNGGTDDVAGLSATGRFLRITSLGRTTQWGNSLWEVEVHGDPDPSCNQADPSDSLLIQAQDYARAVESDGQNHGASESPQCDRGDGVDLQSTEDHAGTCNVGWTEPGESLEYDFVLSEARDWQVSLRVASGVHGRRVQLETEDGTLLGAAIVTNQGWQDFETRQFTAALPSGEQTLRVVFPDGGVNLNYLQFD